MKIPELVSQLESLGYYRYVDAAQLDEVRVSDLESGYLVGLGIGRDFPADGEELPSAGVEDFLRDIEPFLARQGVNLALEEDESEGYDYFVRVNGRRFMIYSREENELTKQGLESPAGDIWTLSTRRTMEIVNWLLEDAGSPERMYVDGDGWNGQLAVFLTPAMVELIAQSGVLEPEDLPCSVADLTK